MNNEGEGSIHPSDQARITIQHLIDEGYLSYITSSAEEIEQSTIEIYPNPTYDIVNIKTVDDILISSVIITDVTGRKVKEINLTAADNTGNDHIVIHDIRSYLNPGIYIISITIDQGIVNKKVIIE